MEVSFCGAPPLSRFTVIAGARIAALSSAAGSGGGAATRSGPSLGKTLSGAVWSSLPASNSTNEEKRRSPGPVALSDATFPFKVVMSNDCTRSVVDCFGGLARDEHPSAVAAATMRQRTRLVEDAMHSPRELIVVRALDGPGSSFGGCPLGVKASERCRLDVR